MSEHMSHCRQILLGILIFLIAATGGADDTLVYLSGDKITLTARNTPLREILTYFQKNGIQVKIAPGINPPITASFKNRNIQHALEGILKDLDYALIWKKYDNQASSEIRLHEIIIFNPGQMDQAKPFERSKTLDIVKNKDGDYVVKNTLLIGLKRSMSFKDLEKILSEVGGRIEGDSNALGLYKIILPEGSDLDRALDRLKRHKEIAAIEPDYAYPISEGVRLEDSNDSKDDATSPVYTDGSVPVAVLDTGLMAQYALKGFSHASLDAVSPEGSISDELGHGTQMALIASGEITPTGEDADKGYANPVISIRIFDDNGYTSNSILMESIDFAVENGSKVLSLSWGSETRSGFMENAVNYAASKGLVVVAAAGNSPTGKPVYPAAYQSVISVAALAPDGSPWEKSNYGSFVDLSAPGFASLPVGYKGDPGNYAGTSIATAYVAGKIASILRKKPEMSLGQVVHQLKTELR